MLGPEQRRSVGQQQQHAKSGAGVDNCRWQQRHCTVVAGDSHSCAMVNGGVQCWGHNAYGQLGNSSYRPSLVPVQMIAAGSNVMAAAASLNHCCAVVNGGVRCWGDNGASQLGNNSPTQSLVPMQAIAAGGNATEVTGRQQHGCAMISGGVQCWGSNEKGQLGNNSTTQSVSTGDRRLGPAATSRRWRLASSTRARLSAAACGDGATTVVVSWAITAPRKASCRCRRLRRAAMSRRCQPVPTIVARW